MLVYSLKEEIISSAWIFLDTDAFLWVFGVFFGVFFFTKHTPAAAGSMACQGLTKPQSGYKLSCLRSRDGDIKQKKKRGICTL